MSAFVESAVRLYSDIQRRGALTLLHLENLKKLLSVHCAPKMESFSLATINPSQKVSQEHIQVEFSFPSLCQRLNYYQL